MAKRSETYVLERGGTILAGRYRVIELLGVGAMGSVWIAEQLALKRKVVVKFHEEAFVGARAELAIERFRREARTLASVRHRNVIELYEHGRTNSGEPYLILEPLSGETLAARMRCEETIAIGEALSIAIAICFGLEAVHAAGILHRDVKPENIFLHEGELEMVPKLLDFGLARRADEQGRVSWSGSAIGTPGYMAPEQARGYGDLDHRADLFALGVTLYEMLSRELPFAGESAIDLVMASATEEPTPLSVWDSRLRGPIEDLVMKAIARDRKARFADARSMRLALTALRLELQSTAAPIRSQRAKARRPTPKPALARPPAPRRTARRESSDPPPR